MALDGILSNSTTVCGQRPKCRDHAFDSARPSRSKSSGAALGESILSLFYMEV